jgi:hypothetical protein
MSNRPKTTTSNPVSGLQFCNGQEHLRRQPQTDQWLQLGLNDPSLFIQHGIIDGKYVDSSDAKTFDVDGEW